MMLLRGRSCTLSDTIRGILNVIHGLALSYGQSLPMNNWHFDWLGHRLKCILMSGLKFLMQLLCVGKT